MQIVHEQTQRSCLGFEKDTQLLHPGDCGIVTQSCKRNLIVMGSNLIAMASLVLIVSIVSPTSEPKKSDMFSTCSALLRGTAETSLGRGSKWAISDHMRSVSSNYSRACDRLSGLLWFLNPKPGRPNITTSVLDSACQNEPTSLSRFVPAFSQLYLFLEKHG